MPPQDIPKSNDRAPSRTFYTWRVDIEAACSRVSMELYRAAGNVWQRLQHELEQHHDVNEMLQRFKQTGQLAHSLTDTQKQQIAHLQRASEILENSLLHMDRMIALYNDW